MPRTNGHQPRFWLALLTVAVLLAGCASPALTAIPTLAPTPAAPSTPVAVTSTQTPIPTETAAAVPTEVVTPVPTEEPTPEPTETPSPTPTLVPIPTPRPTAGPNLAISTVARAPADPAAAKTAAASINAFGLDLFRQLLTDPSLTQKNAVFSPTSIALALAMARAGAKGETASQMDAVLHTSGWDQLGPGLNSLDQALASRDATWQDDLRAEHAARPADRQRRLRPAGLEHRAALPRRIAAAFGAGLRLVDFQTNAEAARKTINAWVSDQTAEARSRELLGQGTVDPSTRSSSSMRST